MNKSTEIYFHYFLPKNSHSMNALVRNRCEYRFLEILNELCYSYGIYYEIDSEVKEEGGIVDWWNVVSTNSTAIQTVCAVLTLFITGAVSLKTLLPDEEKKLRLELLKLQIQEAKNNKTVIENISVDEALTKDEPEIDALSALKELELNKSMRVHRSIFYDQLLSEKRVVKFSAGIKDSWVERVVGSENFEDFLVKRPEKIDESVELVSIALVSPVFKRRKYKWKGLLSGDPISFKVSDRDFNKLIRNNIFSFKNNDVIECSIQIKGEVDFLGDWISKEYIVTKVHTVIKDGVRVRVAPYDISDKNFGNEIEQGSLFKF